MENLDYICIKYGQQMHKDERSESIIKNALGVLKEDGVYAMFLWLETKGKEINRKIIPLLNEDAIRKILLKGSDRFPDDFNKLMGTLKDIAQDIDKLLLMKKLLERTLTYALYHSKINESAENVEKA